MINFYRQQTSKLNIKNLKTKKINWISYGGCCVATSVLRMFTACGIVFKEITLVGSNQGNYFENETACSKYTLKTTVATQLKSKISFEK
jgi:hypothetical protein